VIRLLILLVALALPTQAEEVVSGLSQKRVSITANFEGSEILIFGAVKRDEPVDSEAGKLDVLITVAGPDVPLTIRRKEKRFGIWVNTDFIEVDSAPSFYKVATSGPFRTTMSNVEDLRHQVSIERAIKSIGATETAEGVKDFTDALIRIRSRQHAYQEQPYTIVFQQQTLFRTTVKLPANLTEGDYIVRIFLTREGKVVDMHETVIDVSKVGLERWIYNLAHERPLIYGLLSLAIAIAAGWAASAVFRYIRS